MIIFLTGCARPAEEVLPLPEPGLSVESYTPTPSQTSTTAPTLTPTFNPLMTLSPTLTPSPTPDLFSEMYIDALAERTYGGGVLEDLGVLPSSSSSFDRRLFRFRSDGLNMFGFINIPKGDGPFPVIFMFHGHVEPKEYATLDYSVRYADALAEAGYIVLHPNLRGYAPSPPAEQFARNRRYGRRAEPDRSRPPASRVRWTAEKRGQGTHRPLGAQHGRRDRHARAGHRQGD